MSHLKLVNGCSLVTDLSVYRENKQRLESLLIKELKKTILEYNNLCETQDNLNQASKELGELL